MDLIEVEFYQALKCDTLEPMRIWLERHKNSIKEMNNELLLLHGATLHSTAEICKLILESGIDPNVKDESGNTSLLVALIKNKLDIAEVLITSGASVLIPDNLGYVLQFIHFEIQLTCFIL